MPQAISDSYGALSLEDWVRTRDANLRALAGGVEGTYVRSWEALIDLSKGQHHAAAEHLKAVRDEQFFGTIAGSGLLGLSFFIFWLGVFARSVQPLVLAVVFSLAVWVILMFMPGATVLHQGSLFPGFVLITGTIFLIGRVSRPAAGAMVTAHSLLTMFQYVF